MKTRLLSLFGMCVLLIASTRADDTSAARLLFKAISAANSVELLRLDPSLGSAPGGRKNPDAPGTIDGWRIVASKTIEDRGDIARLAASLQESVAQADPRLAALCFNPRHALRFRVGRIERVVVVCFQCLHGYARGVPGADSFQLERGGRAEADWEDVFTRSGMARPKKS